MSLHPQAHTGRPHNFQENQRVCRIVLGHQGYNPLWWVKAVAFDAIIGNVDRHSENWGFLVRRSDRGNPTYSMAPYYDNGTSLGYELTAAKAEELLRNAVALEAYIDRGKHHIGWDMQSDVATGHFDLLERVIKTIPAASGAVESMIRFEEKLIRPMIAKLTEYDVGIPFTPLRAELVVALLEARLRRVRKLLEG
jgi:hypothetical protein